MYVAAPLTLVGGGGGALLGVAALVGGWGWVSHLIADRLALRELVLGFAARPPAAEGHPYGCRRCGGPLPVAGDKVVIGCIFCQAENVVGLDALGHDRGAGAADSSMFAAALRARASQRARATFKLVFGGLLAAGGVVAVLAQALGR